MTPHRSSWLGSVLSLVVLVGFAAEPASADVDRWQEKARKSGLVVVGECEEAESHWEGGAIYTHSLIRVNERVQGPAKDWVTLRQRGGTVGRIGQKVTHERLVEPGESYLLFLRETPAGMWRAGAGDVVRVRTDREGRKHVAGEALETVVRRLGGSR